jgi:hypothetical protein
MNQRIRQLAEQAGAQFIDGSKDYFGETHPAGVLLDNLDLEEFAKSLIRKCAGIADLADENKCEWIGGNILTHFGVEE